MHYYQRPNLIRDIALLCLSVGATLSLIVLKPDQGVISALSIVAILGYAVTAIYLFVTIVRHKELHSRYIQQRMRRAEPDILTDELLQLLDTLDIEASGRHVVRYNLGGDRKRLFINKSKIWYVCRLSTEEFGSYNLDTSSETRIENVWTYMIPRQHHSVTLLRHETSEIVSRPAKRPDNERSIAKQLMQHFFEPEEPAKVEATATNLHHLYQHIRHATMA